MPKVMVLGGESSIGSLRNVEELEQGSVERHQDGGGPVACAGELKGDERDRAQGFEEVVAGRAGRDVAGEQVGEDRKSTRLNSSHSQISYAVFCLKKKTT